MGQDTVRCFTTDCRKGLFVNYGQEEGYYRNLRNNIDKMSKVDDP